MKGKTDLQKKSVIDEDIAANACFTVLSNEDNFTALVKQNRSLAEKVRDFFADFLEKIRNALTRLAKNNAEYSALQNDTEAKEKILAMFNKALESSQNNNTAENSSAKYALKEYSQHQIDNWKNSKRIVVYESQNQLQQFIDNARAHKNLNKKIYFGIISDETADFIKQNTGVDVSNCNVSLRADSIIKIFNDHGTEVTELPRGQRPITDQDILKLPQLLGSIDYAVNAGVYTGMGKDGNSTFLNLRSNLDDSITIGAFKQGKYLDLRIHTMYAKRGNYATTADANAPASTSKTRSGKVSSNNTVPQNDTVVNNHDIQNEPKYSLKETSDYSYESLVSKPDMPVTVINDQKDYTPGKSTRENVVDEAQRSALSVGRKDSSGNVYVYVNDTDTEVMLSKRGLRHSLDRRLSIIAPVTENIGPIIKNSIRINELSPEFETIKNSYVLIGIAKNQKNEPYVVSFVVNRASNEVMSIDVLYAVNAKKEATALIEPELSSQSDVSLTASTVSISDLLDYVNRYYPDILPEDVLRHYGYTARPDGVIGESALYSLKEEDNTSIFDDNEELNEAAEDVQNMLRLVSTENNELRKAFDIRTVRQAYVNKHLIKPNSIKIHFQKFSIISNRLCHKIFLQTQSNCKRGV
ncbi:MAG TPA: hypothetical protein IAA48_00520 [Candidatus Eubacterium faecipullorum]|uniref:Phage-Barnase-EndoU-ColicinE5/D-RelE like nuclease 3 domain-containing protein n=1 Tax=Candidatus Eubacterium faecipullorum TaxID=2838571 RepID=A0A9D1RCG1_9FIRM|nr:hypothetical protein [Candidatus Eubacterium faecipullorum]